MVQIIQSQPTLRQNALADGIGQMANSFMGAYQKGQETLRQQALADQDTNMKLAQMGVDATAQDLRDSAAGKYQPKLISPGQEAKPAEYGNELQGPVQPGQGPLRELLSQAVPAKSAVYGASNPLQNYTAVKKAQMERDAKLAEQKYRTGEADIGVKDSTKSLNETKSKEITAKTPYEAQELQARTSHLNGETSLIPTKKQELVSQIGKNNAIAEAAPGKAEQHQIDGLNRDLMTAKGDAQAQLSQKAIVSSKNAMALLNKAQWTGNDRELFAMELSKIASGGVPTQHEVESILPQTAAAKFGKALTFFSSSPQNVNDDRYKKEAKHYLVDLMDINKQYLDARTEKAFRIHGFSNMSEQAKQNYRGVVEYQPALARIEGQRNQNPLAQAMQPQAQGQSVNVNAQNAIPAVAHPHADKAMQWAQQNPNDPRAQAIMQRLGH